MVLVRDLGILVAGVPLVSMLSRLTWSGTQYIQRSFTVYHRGNPFLCEPREEREPRSTELFQALAFKRGVVGTDVIMVDQYWNPGLQRIL